MVMTPMIQNDTERIAQFFSLKTKSITNYNNRLTANVSIRTQGDFQWIGSHTINQNDALPLDITYSNRKYSRLGTISHADVLTLYNNMSYVDEMSIGGVINLTNGAPCSLGSYTEEGKFSVSIVTEYLYRVSATEWYFIANRASNGNVSATIVTVPQVLIPSAVAIFSGVGNNP